MEVIRCVRDHAFPVADAPLIAQVLRPHREHRSNRLSQRLAARGVGLGTEQRRVLVVSGDDLSRLGVGRKPSGQHPARRQATDEPRTADDQIDKPNEVVAHVVQRVSPGCSGGSSLTTQIDRIDVEVGGQQRQSRLVPPPGLRLARDQEQSGQLSVSGADVVELNPADVDELLVLGVGDVGVVWPVWAEGVRVGNHGRRSAPHRAGEHDEPERSGVHRTSSGDVVPSSAPPTALASGSGTRKA